MKLKDVVNDTAERLHYMMKKRKLYRQSGQKRCRCKKTAPYKTHYQVGCEKPLN